MLVISFILWVLSCFSSVSLSNCLFSSAFSVSIITEFHLAFTESLLWCLGASPVAQTVKSPPTVRKPGFDPWVGKIFWRRAWQPTPVFLPGEPPWTEEPGGLQSTGSWRVGHSWATNTFTYFLWCFTLSEFFHKSQSFVHFLKILLNTHIPQILRMLERWWDNHSNLIFREPHLSIINTQFNEIYV